MTDKVILYTIFKTKWGYFGIAGTENGLVRTSLPLPSKMLAKKTVTKGLNNPKYVKNAFKNIQNLITAYFKSSYVNFTKTIPLNIKKLSPFTKKILMTCRNIRFSQTISYKQLAIKAGYPKAIHAVGRALAANPLPLLIPCHRVIKSNGDIGGFSANGGRAMKKKLLNHEQKHKTNQSCSYKS